MTSWQIFFAFMGVAFGVISSSIAVYNAINSRSIKESEENLRVWEKYADHCSKIEQAKTDDGKNLAFVNLLNYIEKLCEMVNDGRFSRKLSETVTKMIRDFLCSLETHAPVELIIAQVDSDPLSYSEIRQFIKNHPITRFNNALFSPNDDNGESASAVAA